MTSCKLLVVGAGQAGQLLVNNIKEQTDLQWQVVGFVDDNLSEKYYCDIPILGSVDDLPKIVQEQGIEKVIIAIPSERGFFLRRVLLLLAEQNKVELLLLPRVSEIVFNNKATYKDLRRLEIEDIVGEMIVKSDQLKLTEHFKNEVVLVTGGGGSIGAELSKQIYLLKPQKLIILDCTEKNLFYIKKVLDSLSDLNILTEVIPILGNINNAILLEYLFQRHNIDIVFHAAAYKHVPIIEDNVYEGVFNNVMGTYNIANLSGKFACQRFILISTDKAVLPSNVMGKTKRAAEKIVDYFGSVFSKTVYTAVRFGNVFNSSGSAVEVFLDQLDKKNTLTITDPEMTRYFMTIPEAVHLVLQASFITKGNGEKYMLEMGDPINIFDLAKCLVRLKGYKISEVDFEVIGKRPGEKKHENLFSPTTEQKMPTSHKRIFVIVPNGSENFAQLHNDVLKLFEALNTEEAANHSTEGANILLRYLDKLL
ncbi:MAG: polysaccharide biosynthesis protein [Patescibacteria group bacterium]